MKNLVFFLILSVFSPNSELNNYNDNSSPYLKALIMHIETLPSIVSDTIIIQKDVFLPDNLPYIINKHTIKYFSEKEVESYKGNKISLKKIFPIETENDLLVIRIADFSYTPKSQLWVGFGGSYYKFKYDCDKMKFTFFEKENYSI